MKMFRLNIKPLAHTVRDFAILSKKIYLRSKIPLILSTAKIERYEKMYDTLAPMKTGSYCGIVISTKNPDDNIITTRNNDDTWFMTFPTKISD